MKLLSILILTLLSVTVAHGQAATAQRVLDAPFSQLVSTVPDGSIRHCLNCQKTNPCVASVDGTQAMAEKLNGVWNCAGGGAAASGVNTLTGTANQIIASASSGNVTLSAPQDIATTSSPQFLGARLGGSSSGFLRFDQSTTPSVSDSNTSRLYFDSITKRFKVSENAGAYKFFATFTALSTNRIPKLDTSLSTGELVNSNLSDTGSLVASTVPIRSTGYRFLIGTNVTAVCDGCMTFANAAGTTFERINYGLSANMVIGGAAGFTFNSGATTNGADVSAGTFIANNSVDGGLALQRTDGTVYIKGPENSGVHYDTWFFTLPVLDGTTGMFLRNTNGTGSTEWAKVDLTSAAAVSGALTVTNGGTGLSTITSNALIKGNGTSAAVVTGVTVDASNNVSTAGGLKLGVSSSVAGNLALEAGTGTSVVANNVQFQAASSVTGYNIVSPTVAGDGLLYNSNSANVVTQTFVNAETILSTTASVNMNTATATTLLTCPTGKSCVVTRVIVRNASTSLTTASYSFGWTSAAFSDVIANATHTELTGATLYTILIAKAGATLGTSTGTFKVLMNTLNGNTSTTTMDVIGYVF